MSILETCVLDGVVNEADFGVKAQAAGFSNQAILDFCQFYNDFVKDPVKHVEDTVGSVVRLLEGSGKPNALSELGVLHQQFHEAVFQENFKAVVEAYEAFVAFSNPYVPQPVPA